MKDILKILKQFRYMILLIIILLAFQASLDLKLPDYTAKIINIGIQKKGIDSSIPEVMRNEIYDIIYLLTDNKPVLEADFQLKSKENIPLSEMEQTLEKYPLLTTESLYFMIDTSSKTKEELAKEFQDEFIFASMLDSDSTELKNLLVPGGNIANNMTLIQFFQSLEDATKKELYQNFQKNLALYETSMIEQISTDFTISEYEKIGINLEKIQINYVIKTGLIMLSLAFLLMLIAISIGYFASRTATKFSYFLRHKVVEKIISFSTQEFNEFSVASLITRSTNDVQQIQSTLIMLLRVLIYAPILGIGALLKVINSSMNWVLGLGIGCIVIIILLLFIFVIPKFKMIQKLFDNLNLVIRERLTGVPVIRAFGTASYEEEKFDKANLSLANVILFCDRTMGILMPTISFIMNGVAILIVWVGAQEIDLGTLQVGTLMAFITYSMQVIMSFLMISMTSIMLPRALVSLRRLIEIFNKDNSIVEKEDMKAFGKTKGKVEFSHVSFAYPSSTEKVLDDISFVSEKGTTTAFIGSTGSGKSTLVNLIPRFFDVTSGTILVDDVNIKDVSLASLREKIGYVPQKGNLFSGTIESNVMFGVDKSNLNNLKKSCEVAQASDFILELDKQYQSEISQGGTNVSGGQRQRLSIARAIAKNPEFYIFDDSFSALDFKTDANLRKALRNHAKDATIFIVAQRVSSIMHADQIIVLDEGKMVGKGTHKELMKNCQVYQEIAHSQLKESELYE